MMDKVIEIKGISLSSIVKYDVGIMDVSKATRNTLGDAYIEVINTKRKIELDLTGLSPDEISLVLNLVSRPPFLVKYQDPQDNGLRTGMFYSGDRRIPGRRFYDGKMEWKSLTFNIIEM